MAIAAGLYYLAELVEEYTTFTVKVRVLSLVDLWARLRAGLQVQIHIIL
jgi:hypothetical protein